MSDAMATKRRAGVLCFRAAAAEAGEIYEFLLVSRRSRPLCEVSIATHDDRYTVPAGKFEAGADDSCEDCALREALEEAGIECKLVQDIGWYSSRSKHDQPIQTRYFLGYCVRMLECWQEDDTRERQWFQAADALQRVSYRRDLVAVINQGLQALQSNMIISSLDQSGALDEADDCQRSKIWRCAAAEGAANDDLQRSLSTSDTEVAEERYMCYSHQVGGHFCMVKPIPGTRLEVELPMQAHREPTRGGSLLKLKTRSGDHCRVNGNNVILKPYDAGEESFYRRLPDGLLAPLLPFTPLFYGTKKLRRDQIENLASEGADVSIQPNQNRLDADPGVMNTNYASQRVRRYLVLEDLASSASRPCFLDLKVGCRQRAAHHNTQKRAHMAAKAAQSTSAALGFRICGMQCYNAETGIAQRYDKYWGQKVTVERMSQTLSKFFMDGQGDEKGLARGMYRELVKAVIDKLGKLEAAIRQLLGMRFWGSSLLVFFDAALTGSSDVEESLKSVRLKIIDFANFEDVGGERPDDEYLCGIKNVQVYLQAMLEGSASDEWLPRRLTLPPSPELQDMEQQRAWDAWQAERSANTHEGRGGAGHVEEEYSEVNAQTISGATGRTLLRELASHQLVRPGGQGRILENESDIAGQNSLLELFS